MKLRALIVGWVSAVRDFVAPRYRPELHYMRGPGPAFARRPVMVQSRGEMQILRARPRHR
ncbi:hypothetical protein DPM33_04870 [Mesorhizobium hawassense]|uniref:Uncharacterized protein n=1 Tax=Mesorhizobium hawassense TaxID=1209954 RepID=A0A330HYQ3_9HYPH|nr:hypothetical protein [Mesorhizobium hawassense]RAZ91819.1 hypothetical protein DPM33_04870 [Mesorhizobium hawassense]